MKKRILYIIPTLSTVYAIHRTINEEHVIDSIINNTTHNVFRRCTDLIDLVRQYGDSNTIRKNFQQINQPFSSKLNDSLDYFNKAIDFQTRGKLHEAIKYYDKAISLKLDFHEAHFKKGNALLSLSRFEEAIAEFYKAILIKPDYIEAYSKMGFAYECLGNYDKALNTFDKILLLDRENKDAQRHKDKLEQFLSATKSTFKFDIYISYCSSEKSKAKELHDFLKKQGISCFMKDVTESNKNDFDELVDGMLSSHLVLLCLSKDYLESFDCFREFNFAMQYKSKKNLIPFVFGKMQDLPRQHEIFFMLSDTPYFENINPSVKSSEKSMNFISHLQKIIN